MDLVKKQTSLEDLANALKNTKELGEKQELLLAHQNVEKCLSEGFLDSFLAIADDLSSKIALFSVVAINQHCRVFSYPHEKPPRDKVRSLLSLLVSIDHFYESIGGIVGYHLKVLKSLNAQEEPKRKAYQFSKLEGIDLSTTSSEVEKALLTGIHALPEIGEIYPIGGLGSRLNLKSKTDEPLPAACLPFCGRSLLEGLVRDVQAREFLYYRLFQKQVTVPIAMMTSFEKQNTSRMRLICEKRNWFGRPKESFFLFPQLSVPVVTKEGEWSMVAPLEPELQPGGHGALWRTAEERGVLVWFQCQEKNHLLIRQINNPIGGINHTLFALVGVGKLEKKTFGFASCERLPEAAEGVLVLVQEQQKKWLSNIEYTEFKKYGIEGCHYPANTNILYANLPKLLPYVKRNPLPGLILNLKNKKGGRLESMMQNISDALVVSSQEPLPTFVTYNARRRTISVTKKSYEKGKQLLETPEGAFYDLLYNSYELLKEFCHAKVPLFPSQEKYLEEGPSILFLYHPALGPLYSLIRQKLHQLSLREKSELQLEIADVLMEKVEIEGSLLIFADNIMGHLSQGIVRYSMRTGKAVLRNVKVKNGGMHPRQPTPYWKNQIKRRGALKIFLEGHSEFYAENVVFEGDQRIAVPDGERWIATQDEEGKISYQIEKPGWKWEYKERGNSIVLDSTSRRPS